VRREATQDSRAGCPAIFCKYTLVGTLGFDAVLESLRAYVPRDALGLTARHVVLSPPRGKHRATLGYPYALWFTDSVYKARHALELLPCIDVWIEEQSARLSQYVAGVEITGFSDHVASGESDPRVMKLLFRELPSARLSTAAAGLEMHEPLIAQQRDRLPQALLDVVLHGLERAVYPHSRSQALGWSSPTR
jgi:hypothetical protein